MYILVDLYASLASAIYLNALKMLETRLGRREETELARCAKKTTCVESSVELVKFSIGRSLSVSMATSESWHAFRHMIDNLLNPLQTT